MYHLVVKSVSSHTANVVLIHKMPKVVIDENIVYRMKWFWICGTVAVVLWFLFSYVRFLRRLIGCIRLQEGVYQPAAALTLLRSHCVLARLGSHRAVGLPLPLVESDILIE